MAGTTERIVQTACGWCGKAIVQSGKGRRRLYCDRSCRQRAYEVRTANARHDEARTTAEVLPTPAEQVIERVIEADYPTTPEGWVKALDELTARIRDGRIPFPRRRWIHAATLTVIAALEQPLPRGPGFAFFASDQPFQTAAGPRPLMTTLLEEFIAATPAGTDALVRLVRLHRADEQQTANTSLERLAAKINARTDAVREALCVLHDGGHATLARNGTQVHPGSLATHARFTLVIAPVPMR